MKVFISWSGERSGRVAEQLREWLSYLFESIEPWVSRSDIEAGARWDIEIQEELAATSFGILCLTRENIAAPWILFEAGALAKALNDTFVVPYLLDLRPSEIPGGPLTQFQAKFADHKGTWELVKGINLALKDKGREHDKLARIFERWWPDLEKVLSQISSESAPVQITRPVPDMIDEILVAVRNLERRLPLAPSATYIDAVPSSDLRSLQSITDEARRSAVLSAIREANGNKGIAAERLGISLSILYELLKRYSMLEQPAPNPASPAAG